MTPYTSSPHSREPDSALSDAELQKGRRLTRQEQVADAARKMRTRAAVEELQANRRDADPLFGGEARVHRLMTLADEAIAAQERLIAKDGLRLSHQLSLSSLKSSRGEA